MPSSRPEIEIRRVTIEDIIGLRQAVIIAGTDRTTPYFDGDHSPDTCHFAVYHRDQTIGCATFVLNAWEDAPAWQLRGMATDPGWQGRGVGSAMLQFAETYLREHQSVRQLWCNARIAAVPFYERLGWSLESDVFEISGVGPHRKMSKTI